MKNIEYKLQIQSYSRIKNKLIKNLYNLHYKILALAITLSSFSLESAFAAAELKVLSGEQMIKVVESSKLKSKGIFMFASWCGYCKQSMPEFIQMPNKDLKDKFQVFYISLDNNYDSLVKFSQNLEDNIVIYHMPKLEDITAFFNKFHIKYNNNVPHVTVLDQQNKIIFDGRGSPSSIEGKVLKYLDTSEQNVSK